MNCRFVIFYTQDLLTCVYYLLDWQVENMEDDILITNIPSVSHATLYLQGDEEVTFDAAHIVSLTQDHSG